MRNNIRLPNLVIQSAGQNSNALTNLRYGRGVVIQAPAVLTGTVTVEVTLDGSTWATLQSGGTDVAVGAGKAVVIDITAFAGLRVHSGTAEAAQRTFFVYLAEEM